MTLHHGDCLEVMAGFEADSVDAVVTDPPYGLEFMGKEWDRLDWRDGGGFSKPGIGDRPTAWTSFGGDTANATCATCGGRMRGKRKCGCAEPDWRVKGAAMTNRATERSHGMQAFHARWAEAAYRVAKPSAYLLAFGGTRTVHRMTVALEDAGWIIRDMLVWAYASGFPKSKASLKPAWEPIVMARKPGPLRMLAIDACRIPIGERDAEFRDAPGKGQVGVVTYGDWDMEHRVPMDHPASARHDALGRWPSNLILTDPIFDGGIEGVVGGGETAIAPPYRITEDHVAAAAFPVTGNGPTYGDTGTYSRFFLIPKADRADREPVLGNRNGRGSLLGRSPGRSVGRDGSDDPALHQPAPFLLQGVGTDPEIVARRNTHPTVKPVDLMRHLIRLVTPTGGTVLDPFLGSGTTAIAAELEGFDWIGIEKEAEYVQIAEARLNGTQRGLGLPA